MCDSGTDWLRELLEEGPAAYSMFNPDSSCAISHGVNFATNDPANSITPCYQSFPQFLGGSAELTSMHDTLFGDNTTASMGFGGLGVVTQQACGAGDSLALGASSAPQPNNRHALQPNVMPTPMQLRSGWQSVSTITTQGPAAVQQNWSTAGMQQLQLPQLAEQHAAPMQPVLHSTFLQQAQQQGQQRQAIVNDERLQFEVQNSLNMPRFQLDLQLPLQAAAVATHELALFAPLPAEQQQQSLQWQPQQLASKVAAAPSHTAASTESDEHGANTSRMRSNSRGRKPAAEPKGGRQLTKSGAASQRYRERQRCLMESLEAEVADKMSQLQVLRAENEMLKLRASVLESTVNNRENTMQVTREHGPPIYDVASSKLPGADGNTEQQQQQEEGNAHPTIKVKPEPGSEALHAHAYSIDAIPSSSSSDNINSAAAATGQGADSCIAASHSHSTGSKQYAGTQAPLRAATQMTCSNSTPDLIKRMSVEDILQHWQQFLREFSDELLLVQQEAAAAQQQQTDRGAAAAAPAADHDSVDSRGFSNMSEQRLKDLTERARYLFQVSATLNPAAYCQLFGRNLDTGLPAAYDDSHWRLVLGRLGLTESQARHIVACSELYFPSLHKLQQERRTLQQQLQASGPAQHLIIETDGSAPMQPLLEALATNLKREHVLRVMMTTFVWDEVLTAVQKAKCAVYAHPLFPDTHAMVCVLAQDRLQARLAQGLPPRFVFPHRHDSAMRSQLMQEVRVQPQRQ